MVWLALRSITISPSRVHDQSVELRRSPKKYVVRDLRCRLGIDEENVVAIERTGHEFLEARGFSDTVDTEPRQYFAYIAEDFMLAVILLHQLAEASLRNPTPRPYSVGLCYCPSDKPHRRQRAQRQASCNRIRILHLIGSTEDKLHI
jgi:hypothetical protein